MQAIYFLSPVLYRREDLPQWLVDILVISNPLFNQIEFFRDIFFSGVLPDPKLFAINLASSLVVLALGLWIFKRSEDKFLYFV
jgi:ABC-2 type transport system permease protein